jgi:hypothetical protein
MNFGTIRPCTSIFSHNPFRCPLLPFIAPITHYSHCSSRLILHQCTLFGCPSRLSLSIRCPLFSDFNAVHSHCEALCVSISCIHQCAAVFHWWAFIFDPKMRDNGIQWGADEGRSGEREHREQRLHVRELRNGCVQKNGRTRSDSWLLRVSEYAAQRLYHRFNYPSLRYLVFPAHNIHVAWKKFWNCTAPSGRCLNGEGKIKSSREWVGGLVNVNE